MAGFEYTPFFKKIYLLLFPISGVACMLCLQIYGKTEMSFAFLIAWLIFGSVGFTYCGKLRVDECGLSALNNKGELLVHIPWTQIPCCKVYPQYHGDPIFCVCFKNISYSVDSVEKKPLKNIQEGLTIKRYGSKVLCDNDLRKLCFGRMTPEAFASKEAFGFLVSESQGEQVRLWWSQANEPDASSVNDQSGDRPI